MKTINRLLILLSLPFTMWACHQESEFNLKPNDTFRIANSGASIIYRSKIGNDMNSAMDSIKRIYVLTRPDLLADSIQPQKLEVDFPHDNRLFWLLKVKWSDPEFSDVFSLDDVVDAEGNHYSYVSPED